MLHSMYARKNPPTMFPMVTGHRLPKMNEPVVMPYCAAPPDMSATGKKSRLARPCSQPHATYVLMHSQMPMNFSVPLLAANDCVTAMVMRMPPPTARQNASPPVSIALCSAISAHGPTHSMPPATAMVAMPSRPTQLPTNMVPSTRRPSSMLSTWRDLVAPCVNCSGASHAQPTATSDPVNASPPRVVTRKMLRGNPMAPNRKRAMPGLAIAIAGTSPPRDAHRMPPKPMKIPAMNDLHMRTVKLMLDAPTAASARAAMVSALAACGMPTVPGFAMSFEAGSTAFAGNDTSLWT
mmetsp:Transcript_23773/g.58276  ORF Transcript_23773/g.58276 Transcript_23773/m.58276 type:complete len:294 (+) Transcript_23773:329-1210(+)